MIIVKLMGGLGNQMFQYAFGKQLALKHGGGFKVDTSYLKDGSLNGSKEIRNFGLDNFNIGAAVALAEETKVYHQKSKLGKLLHLCFLYLPLKVNHLYIREPYFRFFKRALDAPEDCYLDGYWQSEKYFSGIRAELLKEFKPDKELSDLSKQLAARMKTHQSVSIHVRKGDYISVADNRSLYAVCDADYYNAAINKIYETVENPVFYVFSDEQEWFRNNVQTDYEIKYVSHNTGSNSYQDLYLMSLCKHNIIANSSFSWWGAWLNDNKEKKVIAPKKWFNNNKDTRDLIPESWIQL